MHKKDYQKFYKEVMVALFILEINLIYDMILIRFFYILIFYF